MAALLDGRPATLETCLATLRRYAEVRCRYETLHYFVQDGLLSPEAVVDKLRRGTFMPPPSEACPAASPEDAFADKHELQAYFALPREARGLTRHEAWLLFAALGECADARAADVALDALYAYAAALWEARYMTRVVGEATPEEQQVFDNMVARGVSTVGLKRAGV